MGGLVRAGFVVVLAAALALGCKDGSRARGRGFSVELPPGWKVIEGSGSNLLHLADAQGRYFVVERDPEGHGLGGDVIWDIEARGDRLEILSESGQCELPPGTTREEHDLEMGGHGCTVGDGRLDAYALSPHLVGGRAFVLYFGDQRREAGVELEPFRALVRSVRLE